MSGIVRFGTVDAIGSATIAVFDLATARRLFGKEGKLDLIRVPARGRVSDAELLRQIHRAPVRDDAGEDRGHRRRYSTLRSFRAWRELTRSRSLEHSAIRVMKEWSRCCSGQSSRTSLKRHAVAVVCLKTASALNRRVAYHSGRKSRRGRAGKMAD